jgi:hypothetical protein
MDIQTLARRVLLMMREQKAYFNSRDPVQLGKCKQIEADLKRDCEALLSPETRTPLFPHEEEA